MKTKALSVLVAASIAGVGCGGNPTSYSIIPTSQTFKQANVSTTNDKMDILFVVDNSGSMQAFQQNLANNFNSFIQQFLTKNFDFQIAVTTTDAYLALPQFDNNNSYSKFKDGVGNTHSRVFVINPKTPNLQQTFITNVLQGMNGSGDERAFSSMKAALKDPQNAGFPRPNAYLSVIILSDEDDFSDETRPEYSWLSGGVADHNYQDPKLESVQSYKGFFDSLTNSQPGLPRYSVSVITVADQNCLTSHLAQTTATIIGKRYIDLAQLTNGVIGSLCDASYAKSLTAIQQNIIELGTQFYLDRVPVVSSISVAVNGQSIANDPTNGWTYDPVANSIIFHGNAVPSSGASISVNFDPATLSF